MDEAVVRHRVGQGVPLGDDFAQDIMHVLEPRGRSHEMEKDQVKSTGGYGHSMGSCHEDADSGDDAWRTGFPDVVQPQGPVGTTSPVDRRPENKGRVEDLGCAASGRSGGFPSKPRATRPRSRDHSRGRRRMYASDAGRTVVVLASVPTVTREAQSMPASATLLGSGSSQSMIAASKDVGGGSHMATDQAVLPWPLGRRCW